MCNTRAKGILLAEELKKENPKRSYYMEKALSYFDHFKDGLFLYRKDGRYPIDNNLDGTSGEAVHGDAESNPTLRQ